MRIIISKDKEKVRRWAIRQNRKVLWKNKHGIWHAAVSERDVPTDAVEVEKL